MNRSAQKSPFIGLLVVLNTFGIASCKSDSREPPKQAGSPTHGCITIGTPNLPPDATLHRGTWSTTVVDTHASAQLGAVRATWTYAMIDGVPHGQQACVDVDRVREDVAIAPDITAVDFVGGGPAPVLRLRVDVTVLGPARVEDGRTLNHPEASMAWVLKARADGVETENEHGGTSPEFRPSWNSAKLGAEEPKVMVERIARP